MQSWLLPLLALALAIVALAAREVEVRADDPIPTMSSTSWVAPGWTPTMQPWPPRKAHRVLLPEVRNGE